VGVEPKEFRWIASALKDLAKLPDDVKRMMGFALWLAQQGEKHPDAKPLKGFGGGAVLEVVEDHDGDTYRAVYTVRFRDAVYLLHAFQKKSKRGSRTPKADIDLIRARLKLAEDDYREQQKRKEQDT
jgi:phage-related protein